MVIHCTYMGLSIGICMVLGSHLFVLGSDAWKNIVVYWMALCFVSGRKERLVFQSHYVNASGDLKGVTTPTYIHTYV